MSPLEPGRRGDRAAFARFPLPLRRINAIKEPRVAPLANPCLFLLVAAFALAGCRMTAVPVEAAPGVAERPLAADPAAATFEIDGQAVTLAGEREPRAETPEATTPARTRRFGSPVFADLDADGDEDAVLLLHHDPGGSGTFTYVAAAIREGSGHRGTNALLVGDRVAVRELKVNNGAIEVLYLDRAPGEPMVATPTALQRLLLMLEAGALRALPPLAAGEAVVEGWVVIGHEVRSFAPCSGLGELWLRGESPALAAIIAAHARVAQPGKPYAPVFMLLTGRPVERPEDGFGAEYTGGFAASRLLAAPARGGCHSDLIRVDSPVAGERVASPLRLRGRARGSWFFEGDFPVVLEDARGNVLATGFASAHGEWMTEHFVPFAGSLEFAPPASGERGTLVLHKNNPSDQRELDAELAIPIFFH